jgi:hypothetical protein
MLDEMVMPGAAGPGYHGAVAEELEAEIVRLPRSGALGTAAGLLDEKR